MSIFYFRELGSLNPRRIYIRAPDQEAAVQIMRDRLQIDPYAVCEDCADSHWMIEDGVQRFPDPKALSGITIIDEPAPMDDFSAVLIAEGVQDADEADQLRAWQHLIDTGLAWKLQGFFGCAAGSLIEQGVCHA